MSNPRRSIAYLVACMAWLVFALAGPMTASAFTITQQVVKIDGLISVSPSRYEGDVTPGQTSNIGLSVINKTSETLTIHLKTVDLKAEDDAAGFVGAVTKARYGASSWMRAERDTFVLKSGEEAKQVLRVTPPLNAPVGDNFAGIVVDSVGVNPTKAPTGGARVSVHTTGLVQLFFTVPGAIKHDTRILRTEVDDSLLIGNNRFVTYTVRLKNVGNVNDHVSGKLVVTSLFGNRVVSIPIPRQLLLRGSTREIRVFWSHPPWFGRFHADVEMKTEDPDHPTIHRSPPSVTILPPWWVLALLVGSIVVGVGYTWWRRNQAWKRYLDDDWDDDWDDEEYEGLEHG